LRYLSIDIIRIFNEDHFRLFLVAASLHGQIGIHLAFSQENMLNAKNEFQRYVFLQGDHGQRAPQIFVGGMSASRFNYFGGDSGKKACI